MHLCLLNRAIALLPSRWTTSIWLLVIGQWSMVNAPLHAAQPYTPHHPDPVLESWRWRSYPELDGLGLQCMTEDHDGNLWFGTRSGAYRYDGQTWTVYPFDNGLHGEVVHRLCTARDGSVYAGTNSGISRFQNGEWTRVFPREPDTHVGVTGLQAGDDSVWAATLWGVVHIALDGITIYSTTDFIPALRQTVPGVSIVEVPGEAIPIRDFGFRNLAGALTLQTHIFIVVPGSPAAKAGAEVADRIITGKREGGRAHLSLRRPGHPQLIEISLSVQDTLRRSYHAFHPGDVLPDLDGRAWIGLHGTIIRADGIRSPGQTSWQRYDPSGQSSRSRLARSSDGAVWSTWSNAFSRFDGKGWTTLKSLSEILPEIQYPVAFSILGASDGTIWIGGREAIFAYRNNNFAGYPRPDVPIPSARILDLHETSDRALWFITNGKEPLRLDLTDRWTTYAGLYFRGEDKSGRQWFDTDDGGIVKHDPLARAADRSWVRYDPTDGLMEKPIHAAVAPSGDIWAIGHHHSTVSLARFDGEGWDRHTFEGVKDNTAFHAAEDGSLWIGAWGQGVWHLDPQDLAEGKNVLTQLYGPAAHGIAQTSDGTIWAGGYGGLFRYDGDAWKRITDPAGLGTSFVDVVYVGPSGDLWVGHRSTGAYRYDGEAWQHFDVRNGLADNRVFSIVELVDGSVLVATEGGFSRFDGRSWSQEVFPPELIPNNNWGLKTSRDGSIWINIGDRDNKQCVRYRPDIDPPESRITLSFEEVSQPGNTTLAWTASDPWRVTSQERLQFSYRLNDNEWTEFTTLQNHVFQALPSGDYRFDVRARDADFNVDPTPARMMFTVLPPVWKQPWFIGLIVVFIGVTGYQANRIVSSNRSLREGNQALSDANNELFQVNTVLQREQVLERLRGQAQGMQSSEDIGPMVEAVFREVKGLGLPLISSSVAIYLSDTEMRLWITAEDGSVPYSRVVQRRQGPIEARERGDEYHHSYSEGERTRQGLRALVARDHPRWKGVPEERWPSRTNAYRVFFDRGEVGVTTEDPIAEDDLMLAKRFGEVFEYAYLRWEELKAKELQNRRLAVDAAVQHLRAEVQSMDEVSDFDQILSLLTESLKTVELSFEGCEIDVLDEPVENPTMDLFEENGFRYTTYTLEPSGQVHSEAFNLLAPFPAVNRQTIERFIAGEPWQGLSDDQRIVEVPAGSYGRLRLTASDRDPFNEGEIATLREFADAIALGYARYLDIREIQLATERKSAFLAAMSHELRTPMNAIKGFTNLVLRRGKEELSERNQGNLEKVSQASDHLLAMINDLLDLSKIEAGRMDVSPETFDVGELIRSCCDTVSPLVKDGVELTHEVAGDGGEANTDRARLQQIGHQPLVQRHQVHGFGKRVCDSRGAERRGRGGKPGHCSS